MKNPMIFMFPPKPSPIEMATKELVNAQHALLSAQSGAEYALSQVQYNEHRIRRLNKYINDATAGQP